MSVDAGTQTLANLVLDSLDTEGARRALERGDFAELKGALSEYGQADFPASLDLLAGGMLAALDVKLGDIFRSGWAKLNEVRDAIEATKKPGAKHQIVPLLRHEIHSTHEPGVDVHFGEKHLGRLILELDLALVLEGIRLVIKGGSILEISSGSFSSTGKMQIKGTGYMASAKAEIIKKNTEPVELTGRWAV